MDVEVGTSIQSEESVELKLEKLNDSTDYELENVEDLEYCGNLVDGNRIDFNNLTPMYSEQGSGSVDTQDTDLNSYLGKEGEEVKDDSKCETSTEQVEEPSNKEESPRSDKNDKLDEKNEDLPEGWVRCGKGLRMDFPNTPKNESEKNVESKNLFINFTEGGSVIKTEKSLQSALMNLDRKAVRELKGSLVAIKASKASTDRLYNQSARLNLTTNNGYAERTNTVEFRKNSHLYAIVIPVVNHLKLLFRTPRRNNTYSAGLTELDMLRAQHKKELEQTKQTLLAHFRDLVELSNDLFRKYRELAVDAINAARNEQKKCQEECKQAYSTAYNACLKYEKDLKNTIRFALKEYKNSNKQSYDAVVYDKNECLRKYENASRTKEAAALSSHKMLREDLSHDYQIDEKLLVNFEPKVVDRLDSVLNQLSLYLEENYNLNHKDSLEFVKSVISHNL
ncbi:conserved hypothetical protein [Theileria orientalis strain Shintoku]|uniref:Uncharacterized protein n=1 Tax=Theileria orientalis strain Shintoku TaxID=869250 RepID=J4C422_THEOR|nr:conserved hypothetical protein [Theileria orientalis strain Shintoku]BAM41431.1 conserved hypothetical protein [Theileria orientalis strain Shintoku]|eukprot:XP_009691732.1 conserved hypothetical protein [Theileria orientalis strain Shintoku]